MKRPGPKTTVALILLLGLTIPSFSQSQDATYPGEITTPYPTLTCLAFEWEIKGDDNQDSKVEVVFRISGEETWITAMPLVRIPAGSTGKRTTPTYTWKNKHSGSIFNLEPDTKYEIRLSLTDPDGGEATELVKAHTRPVPGEAENSRIIKVNPKTLEKAAMFAEPGDILLLSPGYYDHFTMPVDGKPGKPIVLRADNAHPVIGSTFNSVSLEHRKHVIIDGLTVWGPVRLRWAQDVAVVYCDIQSQFGVIAQEQPGCKNCYIADNTVSYKIPWKVLVPAVSGVVRQTLERALSSPDPAMSSATTVFRVSGIVYPPWKTCGYMTRCASIFTTMTFPKDRMTQLRLISP